MEEGLLERAVSMGASYADVRTVRTDRTSLELKDGELKEAVEGHEEGFGLRVLMEGNWGFASANSLEPVAMGRALDRALSLARASARGGGGTIVLAPVPVVVDRVVWAPKKDPRGIAIVEKVELLQDMESAARACEHLSTVTSSYSEGHRVTELVTSEGTRLTTDLTRVMAVAALTGRKEGVIASFRARSGGTGGWELFDRLDPRARTAEAVGSLENLLDAEAAPAGRMVAIVDPDMAGVLVHEAFGHACEADLVMAGDSILEGRLGEELAAEGVTIYDDPSIEGGFGSFPFDDEGVRGGRKVLLDRGVLTSYIHNRETAGHLGHEPNGGARAQDHASRPMVRMSNTCLEAGDMSFEELLEDVKDGIYLRGSRGGEVNVAKGSFQFSAQEAFAVEGGEVTRPLRDVALMGFILETLRDVDGLGKEAVLASPGFCGKGQTVTVSDGGPHVRLRDAVVGGG